MPSVAVGRACVAWLIVAVACGATALAQPAPRRAEANRGTVSFNFNRRRLTLFVEVVNLLGRTNYGPGDGSIRVSTGEAVNYTEKLLPFLPSAGLLVEF